MTWCEMIYRCGAAVVEQEGKCECYSSKMDEGMW